MSGAENTEPRLMARVNRPDLTGRQAAAVWVAWNFEEDRHITKWADSRFAINGGAHCYEVKLNDTLHTFDIYRLA